MGIRGDYLPVHQIGSGLGGIDVDALGGGTQADRGTIDPPSVRTDNPEPFTIRLDRLGKPYADGSGGLDERNILGTDYRATRVTR
jgi:hypothetical protein